MTDIITADFETFYSRDYSLSKVTTEEYIRDPQFEAIGVSVKVNDEPAEWFSGTKAQTKRWLGEWDWGNSIAVAHNAMFDMAILNWHFDLRPKMIADTLSMARAIDGPDAGNSLAKLAERYGVGTKGNEVINALGKRRLDFTPEELARYGEYCINDTEITYKLFTLLAPLICKSEAHLINLTMRMFTEPVLELDKEVLTEHLTRVREKKAALLEAIDADKAVLMSNPKLAELLMQLKVVPPTKISPTTGKSTWAFGKNDEGFKALAEHHNPTVQAIVAARLGVKSTLEETRTERFIGIADRGTLPVPLRYYAAHTGRWGGDDKVNLQNLPRKSPLKKAMLAPEGYVFIDCDSSQIEARTLAWMAGQEDLVDFFQKNNDEIAAGVPKAEMEYDPYKIMASEIYATPVRKISDDQRFVGKTTILGCLAEGTLVLTDRGWVAIEEVTTSDRLWDGDEWVCHQGLVQKGTKETLNLCGLWLTPDHKVLCGTQWLEAQSVAQDRKALFLALGTGAVSWSYPATSKAQEGVLGHSLFSATVDGQSTPSIKTTSRRSKAHAVPHVENERVIGNATGSIPPYSPISHIENDYSTDFPPLSTDATYPLAEYMQAMEGGVLPSVSNGEMIAQSFFDMLKLYWGGTTQTLTWTEPTTIVDTSPVIFGLSQEPITMPIVERSTSYRQNLMTYDIAYAGPRNRYTVATDAGAIIVHNCGYGMGPAKFQIQLKAFGVDMKLTECRYIIDTYRRTYPQIPKVWEQGDAALDALIRTMSAPLGREAVLNVDLFGIRLPNGMYIRYPELRKETNKVTGREEFLYDTKKGRATIPKNIWGGGVTENWSQALARIIIGEQMLMIARRYKVVMTVHDAIGIIAPIEEANEARAFVEACMRTRPKWAGGLPLNCESKMGASYGG
jgi:DNA polymerase I-like protein with 3'-5' exonuclease and polymerase domains